LATVKVADKRSTIPDDPSPDTLRPTDADSFPHLYETSILVFDTNSMVNANGARQFNCA
jgi:hypothetical protein